MKRKIIFAVTNDLTYDQRMQRICRSLSNAGYETELVGREMENSVTLSHEPFLQIRLKCFFEKGKMFYAEFNMRLFFFLLFKKYDAVCAVDLDTITAVYLAGKITGAKLVYDAHEYFTEVPEVVRRPFVKGIWQWIEKTFVPKFNLRYTVSEGVAELFSKNLKAGFEIVMNTPPLSQKFEMSNQKSEKFLLYQGALNEGRGLESLLEAMQHIYCNLKLAGEGDLSEQLRLLAKQRGIEDKVEFLGYVKPDELKRITSESYIGINLLENKGLSYYYSLSNKFFDYIHAGVPQVCIAFPEYQKINSQFEVAVLIENAGAYEIKNSVERLLSDEKLYWQLARNCEVCARQFNWQQEEKKLIALYGQLFG